MPSDGLPLTVFIGGEVDEVCLLGLCLELLDERLLIIGDDIFGTEVVGYVYAEGVLSQVTYVACTRHHSIVCKLMFLEEALDELRLLG